MAGLANRHEGTGIPEGIPTTARHKKDAPMVLLTDVKIAAGRLSAFVLTGRQTECRY